MRRGNDPAGAPYATAAADESAFRDGASLNSRPVSRFLIRR
jgi:hypothetical protein